MLDSIRISIQGHVTMILLSRQLRSMYYWFGFVALLVLGLVLTTIQINKEADEAERWVSHTQQTLSQIAKVENKIKQGDFAAREVYMENHDGSLLPALRSDADYEIEILRGLISDNNLQLEHLNGLTEALALRRKLNNENIAVFDAEGYTAAMENYKRNNSSDALNRINEGIYRLQYDETNLLSERINTARQTRIKLRLVNNVLLAFVCIFGLVSFVLTARKTHHLEKIAEQFREAYERQRSQNRDNLRIEKDIADKIAAILGSESSHT